MIINIIMSDRIGILRMIINITMSVPIRILRMTIKINMSLGGHFENDSQYQ